jgi:hypothetical protein
MGSRQPLAVCQREGKLIGEAEMQSFVEVEERPRGGPDSCQKSKEDNDCGNQVVVPRKPKGATVDLRLGQRHLRSIPRPMHYAVRVKWL